MTVTTGLELVRATSIEDVVSAFDRGGGVRILNGGTEVTRQLSMGEAKVSTLVDIKGISEFRAIAPSGDGVAIGATTKHWDIGVNPDVARLAPGLATACSSLGNLRVRAQGSLAGNLAFGHSQTDPGATLLSQGATIVVVGTNGERRIDIEDLWTGPYQTSVGHDELVTSVEVAPLPVGWVAGYRRVEILHRPPSMTLGVTCRVDDDCITTARIGVGAVGAIPRRLHSIESLLDGVPLESVKEVLETGRNVVRDDLRAIPDQVYRAEEKVSLFINVFNSLLKRFSGGES